ncbi:hypothetical protein [Actinomyces oris]|uniref:hypothetical protein n=1 Tax=Actinomyces oris TaxID=544580 RepID=UPI0015BA4D97|nr:hypothetical protein [Actinomyces oris]
MSATASPSCPSPSRSASRPSLQSRVGPGATGADLARLRDAVVAGVRERYGVTLVPEPVQVGF